MARFLDKQNVPFVVCDTREKPPLLDELHSQFPGTSVYLGSDAGRALASAGELVASPGVAPDEPLLVQARQQGISIIGDIELFARYASAPVVAITGSNGKSTVVTLLGEMAKTAGRRVAVGGNLGTPVLDLLADDCELYVLELSSFQLELTHNLKPAVACILNLSADHLDRYGSMADYLSAKQRIFNGAQHIVCNRDDRASQPQNSQVPVSSFGTTACAAGQYGLAEQGEQQWLCGPQGNILPVDEVRIKGRHNWANALAALALGAAAGLPENAMVTAMKQFPGLEHRCQTVRTLNGVTYINDSKATNVGATLAALDGLASTNRRNIVWIAGGDGKGAEFEELRSSVSRCVKAALLIGSDAARIGKAITGATDVEPQHSLQQAVQRSQQLAQPKDLVLLSPACASFDMFDNFEQRGRQFSQAVEALS